MENSGKEKSLVLIVDDVAKNIQVLAALLYQENYEIAMADSGISALSMLEEGLVPDLILLDVMMPDLDGFETCRRIKKMELLKDVPVIFLTARHETESIVKGFEIGAADYVTKPFNSHELISRVNTHLQLKNKTEQLRNFNELLESKVKERTIELTKANKRLEKLDKAKSYFLDLLSHELITPISGIEGFAKMLKPSLLDEEQLEYADLIIESADRLKKFSDMSRLITMLKSENYRRYDETINLKSLLEESVFDMKDTFDKKSLSILIDSVPDKLNLEADPYLVKRCFHIILSNSAKFSNENCVVRVNACPDNEMVRIDFRDEGVGFSKEALSNLFELFGTDEILNHQEGFGLGLVTAKLIMDLHGGRIKAENNSEKGANVSLFFRVNSNNAS